MRVYQLIALFIIFFMIAIILGSVITKEITIVNCNIEYIDCIEYSYAE